jgi:hypothetical protein
MDTQAFICVLSAAGKGLVMILPSDHYTTSSLNSLAGLPGLKQSYFFCGTRFR